MNYIRPLILVPVALGILIASLALFQVDATEAVIVTQFGQPVQVVTQPGLYTKLPDPFQSVVRVNTQLQLYNVQQTEFLTSDKKNIVVEAYATWKVTDALTFLKTVREPVGAETRLADIVASELGAALGQVELSDLVTVEATGVRLPDTLATVARGASERTRQYGFVVGDVRLKQLTFPQANLTSVFQRMRAEREAIARQFRSEGTEQAAKIRAAADTEKAQILAEANREAAETRGKADAEAIAIYAAAYQKDMEFYRFLRTLQSYETFIDEQTTLIIPSDSELLKYLNPLTTTDPGAAAAPAPAPAAGAVQNTTPTAPVEPSQVVP